MNDLQTDWSDFPEETPKEKLSGIFQALEFIARESEKLGLKFTAHMIGVAADLAIIELSETENPTLTPFKHEHLSKQ
ncbi:MAG: hypothetical protein IH901_00530 [Proteobacteria bacterium]|nr:hypothetical protein [Pseudomonadota bacterium]